MTTLPRFGPEEIAWMQEAMRLAEAVLRRRTAPNPRVGAVVVRDSRVVGRGAHETFGGPHAEIHALTEAGEAARGATLYVTLAPCNHHGKTPPCTEAILGAGVRRVVAAMDDPDACRGEPGPVRLRGEGIETDVGLLRAEAIRLNAPYVKTHGHGVPYTVAKWAMTLDGRIATRTGASKWITSDLSRACARRLRGEADAVVIGVRTALADDPLLTAPAEPTAPPPLRVVLDSRARLPLTARLVRTAGEAPVLVAVTERAPARGVRSLQDAGCRVLTLPSRERRVDMGALARTLAREGIQLLLVEGGAEILASTFEANLVDEVVVFLAPRILGGRNSIGPVGGEGIADIAQALTLENLRVEVSDTDLLLHGHTREGLDRLFPPEDAGRAHLHPSIL